MQLLWTYDNYWQFEVVPELAEFTKIIIAVEIIKLFTNLKFSKLEFVFNLLLQNIKAFSTNRNWQYSVKNNVVIIIKFFMDTRLKLLEKKKTELALKSRKEIADYIALGKVERAKIRVEHIVREDYLVEAMELLEMFCDLLLAR